MEKMRWFLAMLVIAVVAGCASPSPAAPVIVVAEATSAQPAPGLSPMTTDLLETLAGADTPVTVTVIGPGDTPGQVLPLTPMRKEQIEHGPRRDELRRQNLAVLTASLSRLHATAPVEPLALLDKAVRAIGPGPGVVVYTGSGVATVGPLSLVGPEGTGLLSDRDRVVRELAAAHALPDLTDKDVLFSGLGSGAGAQMPAPLPSRSQLVALWVAIGHAAHAKSVTVDETDVPDRAPSGVFPVPRVDWPAVTIAVTGPTTTTTVPAGLLFNRGSAALSEAAGQVLGQLDLGSAASVTVRGWASPDGDEQANEQLAHDRGQAAATYLTTRLGVAAARLRLDPGRVDHSQPQACQPPNSPLATACSVLRRVEIEVTSH